jgi:cytochrome P450 family 135
LIDKIDTELLAEISERRRDPTVANKDDDYLRAVIQESLRLRPVVPLAGRQLVSELRVDGLVLPPATRVTPAIWLTHTRSDVYPEPLAFRPERFLGHHPSTYAWIPFGGGVRRCLGAAFAEMEMRVVLRSLLRTRTVKAASTAAERPTRRNVTLSPRHGTRIILSGRAATKATPPRPRRREVSATMDARLKRDLSCPTYPGT